MRSTILGVVAGYAAWTAIWLGGNAVFFRRVADAVESGAAFTDAGPLWGALALSVVCSLAAGLAATAIARRAVPIVAALLLATGIAVQASAWALLPAWYHLAFLALLVPMTLLGGRLAGRGRTAGTSAAA